MTLNVCLLASESDLLFIVTIPLRNGDVVNSNTLVAEIKQNVFSVTECNNSYSCRKDLAVSAVIFKTKLLNIRYYTLWGQ